MTLTQACHILQIDAHDAEVAQLAKAAFRRLSKALHPDKAGAAADVERFTAVQDAYAVIQSAVKAGDAPLPRQAQGTETQRWTVGQAVQLDWIVAGTAGTPTIERDAYGNIRMSYIIRF